MPPSYQDPAGSLRTGNPFDILQLTVKPFLYTAITKFPALIIGATIWFLSAQSTLPTIKGVLGFDKFLHLTAFFFFTAAVGLWFAPEKWRRRPLLTGLLTLGVGSLYGLIDEAHQYFVPGRSSDIADWVADTLGALLGSGAVWLVSRYVLKKFNYENFFKRTE